MTKYDIYISESAENDIDDIVTYIATRLYSVDTALRMLDDIENAVETLSETPLRYPLMRDERLAALGYHWMPVKSYVVNYSVDENELAVNVERVLYNRREWKALL